jgi:hypothetical protein
MMQTFKNQLMYQIKNCQIRTWPWYHVIFDSVFTNTDYFELIKNLPDKSCLSNIKNVHNSLFFTDYSENRFVLDDVNKITNPNQQQFWAEIYKQLTDGMLCQTVIEKFHDLLVLRMGGDDFNGYSDFYDTVELTLDTAGYDLKPHPDAFDKVFSIVINLSSKNPDQGTAIYASENTRDLIFQSAFLPNTGFGIFRTDDSWHGVEPTTADRWTIQYSVRGRDK